MNRKETYEYYSGLAKSIYDIAHELKKLTLDEEAKKLYDAAEMVEENRDEVDACWEYEA
jgi:hypothetical protein